MGPKINAVTDAAEKELEAQVEYLVAPLKQLWGGLDKGVKDQVFINLLVRMEDARELSSQAWNLPVLIQGAMLQGLRPSWREKALEKALGGEGR